jgi:hypothetical protein
MSDLVIESQGGTTAGEALTTLNDGFLGTGYSASVEVSFILMALVAGYVAVSTARYFISGRGLAAFVAETFGFR